MEKNKRRPLIRVATRQPSTLSRITDRMAASGYEVAADQPEVQVKRPGGFDELERVLQPRLSNWRAAIRTRSGGGGCATSWAAAYVAARNAQELRIAIELQLIAPESNLQYEDVDVLDGWLVEAAVTAIPFPDQREALRLRYVWDYSNHFMKSRLRLNDTSLRIVVGRSLSSLQNVLAKLHCPDKIRANNSHAGIVPSLEALAVPMGTVAPLGNEKALID